MFAKRLKELRKRYGMTQLDIAELVGLSHQAVGKWERGIATPDYDALCKLANRFNCTIDYLVRGKEPIKTETPSIEPLTSEEIMLVELFRHTDEWGKEQIMYAAESNAKRFMGISGKSVKAAM